MGASDPRGRLGPGSAGRRAGRSDRGEPGRGRTLCRRSKVISSRRRDQIAAEEHGGASATMARGAPGGGRSSEVAVGVTQQRAAAESDPAAKRQGELGEGGGGSEMGARKGLIEKLATEGEDFSGEVEAMMR